jgi:hypothetical protein
MWLQNLLAKTAVSCQKPRCHNQENSDLIEAAVRTSNLTAPVRYVLMGHKYYCKVFKYLSQAGSNNSTVDLWVNTGSWPFRLRKSRIGDSKIWSWVLRDSDLRVTELVRASDSCKRQTRLIVREGVKHQQNLNCLTVIGIWSWASDWGLWRRQNWLTVDHNININTWTSLYETWYA